MTAAQHLWETVLLKEWEEVEIQSIRQGKSKLQRTALVFLLPQTGQELRGSSLRGNQNYYPEDTLTRVVIGHPVVLSFSHSDK